MVRRYAHHSRVGADSSPLPGGGASGWRVGRGWRMECACAQWKRADQAIIQVDQSSCVQHFQQRLRHRSHQVVKSDGHEWVCWHSVPPSCRCCTRHQLRDLRLGHTFVGRKFTLDSPAGRSHCAQQRRVQEHRLWLLSNSGLHALCSGQEQQWWHH